MKLERVSGHLRLVIQSKPCSCMTKDVIHMQVRNNISNYFPFASKAANIRTKS